MTCLLYAVTRGDPRLALADARGVHGEPVRVIEAGGFHAAYTEHGAGVGAERANLAAYHGVLERLVGRVEFVPLRFGASAADRPAAVRLVASAAAMWARCLDAIAGGVEMCVRLPDAIEAGDAGRDPSSSGPCGGAGYLLRRRRAINGSGDVPWDAARRVHESAAELRELAHGVRVARSTREARAVVLSFLVRPERVGAFRESAEAWLMESKIAGRVDGPWPPMSFCDLTELDAAARVT